MQQDDKFSVFIPLELFKSGDNSADRYSNMRFKGRFSTTKFGRDSDGELLEVDGMDFSDLEDTGVINWHHSFVERPSAIIGEPIRIEKKGGDAWIEGRLFPNSEKAREVYDLADMLEKDSATRRLGFSLEGKAVLRDPKDKKRILKSKIKGLAITPMPKCKGTAMELIKGWGPEIEYETEQDQEYLVDVTDDHGVRRTVDKYLNVEVWDLEKGGLGSGRKKEHFESELAQQGYKFHSTATDSNGKSTGKVFKHEDGTSVRFHGDKNELEYHDKQGNSLRTRKVDSAFFDKAMVAGAITGTETIGQALTQEPLKEQSLEGTKKKKKKAKLTKGEAILQFIEEGYDVDAAKGMYGIAELIEQLDLEKALVHPERPNHKYIRREQVGDGKYNYYYDEPKKGMYVTNVAPIAHTKTSHVKLPKTAGQIDKELQDRFLEITAQLQKEHPGLKYYVASTQSPNMGTRVFIDFELPKT